MNITFHKIQDGQSRPRSPAVLDRARRANPACGGRTNSAQASRAPLKRGYAAQAAIDCLFVIAALLLVVSAAVAVAGSVLILLFVRT